MEQNRTNNNNINLLWPSSLLLKNAADDGSNDQDQCGYVIGWQDQTSSDNTKHSTNANVNVNTLSYAREDNMDSEVSSNTIVVAGILKDELHLIQDALNILKQDKYPCCNEQTCFACNFVIQELTVVAKWRRGKKFQSKKTSKDNNTMVNHCCQGENELPIIEVTDRGPIMESKELYHWIVYDPCTNGTDCYRHDFDFSTTFSNMKCSQSFGKMKQNRIGGGRRKFHIMMLRLSETVTVMNVLKEILLHGKKLYKCRSYPAGGSSSSLIVDGNGQRQYDIPPTIHAATAVELPTDPCMDPAVSLFYCHLTFNRQLCKNSSLEDDNATAIQEFVVQSPILFLMCSHFDDCRKEQSRSGTESRHYVTREYIGNQRIQRFDSLTKCALDALLGMILGVCLISNSSLFLQCASFCWNTIHKTVLENNIGWLEAFPVGFKLNTPLTKVMGQSILAFIKLYETILLRLITFLKPLLIIRLLGVISIVLGFRGMVSLIYDLAKMSTGHIFIIQRSFRLVLWCQFSLFGSLWHLFRGKKKNVLRQRSDSLEYDFMQLFLGMILFAICLFLFTTVLVYFTFFTLVHWLVSSCIGIMWAFYGIATYFPLGCVVLAYFQPGMFCSRVSFVPIHHLKLLSSCHKEVGGVSYRIQRTSLKPSWIALQAIVKRGFSDGK
jgi:N-acetylglucosaminyl transferase component (Gpi1).